MSNAGPILGIDKLNRRYSTPNWKGAKLSTQSMSKTMNLKLKKINAIRTARSHHQFYLDQEMKQAKEQEFVDTREFFKTHSRVFRSKGFEKKAPIQKNELFIDTKHVQQIKSQEQQAPKTRPVYYSSNLQQKMNLYLNGLINRSQQQHNNKIKEIQLKIEEESMLRKPTLNLQNLFWRKMKRFNSQKRQDLQREQKTPGFSLRIKRSGD